MNDNDNQYQPIRRYRKRGSSSGATVAIIVLSVLVVLVFGVLLLALTGKLNPLIERFTAKETETSPADTVEAESGKETAGATQTGVPATETASVTETETQAPVTDPPVIPGEIEWQFLTMQYEETRKGTLLLVDSTHPYEFPETSSLVNVYSLSGRKYSLINSSVMLDGIAANSFTEMVKEFYKQTGHRDLMISGGYRSYDAQNELYEKYGGTSTFAPGCSDYHLGTALYVKVFGEDGVMKELKNVGGDYEWIYEHAAEYGFIVRYPEDKTAFTGTVTDGEGHLRYVGTAHASVMADKGMCLEEYLDYLTDFTYAGNHLTAEADGVSYEIFSVPLSENGATKVPVPQNHSYSLSGDNCGNVIVTIRLD